jgi:hypothetical protein
VNKPLLCDGNDSETVFRYNSLAPWVKRQQIPLSRMQACFVLGDLRKFTEQHGDIIQWDIKSSVHNDARRERN